MVRKKQKINLLENIEKRKQQKQRAKLIQEKEEKNEDADEDNNCETNIEKLDDIVKCAFFAFLMTVRMK